MRKRPSGKDQDILVKEFAIGEQEIEILKSLLENAICYMPITLETSSTRHRMYSMKRELMRDKPEFEEMKKLK